MRIAVVGATGRIGREAHANFASTRAIRLGQGRGGGPALDALVAIGAEPFTGSFDAGAGQLDHFFHDADAAFLHGQDGLEQHPRPLFGGRCSCSSMRCATPRSSSR